MADVTYTVPNKNGSYDGDYVVKQYTSITINAGDTVTTDQPCRGLMLLCTGDCTINGTLSMKGRGALGNPGASGGSDSNATQGGGLQLPFLTSGGSSSLTAANTLMNGCGTDIRSVVANFKTISSSGDILTITQGGGGDGDTTDGQGATYNGVADTGSTQANSCGGGGQGSAGYQTTGGHAGAGKNSTCFGGGSAGGGINGAGSGVNSSATDYGGVGGNGYSHHTARCTGGCGNPNGTESTVGGYGGATNVASNETGTGGVIWLIVGGNLTIGASGVITCKGSQPDGVNGNGYNWLSTGGGSGGGAIKIAYKGTLSNSGSIDVAGGQGGSMNNGGNYAYVGQGGIGGAGTSTLLQVQ